MIKTSSITQILINSCLPKVTSSTFQILSVRSDFGARVDIRKVLMNNRRKNSRGFEFFKNILLMVPDFKHFPNQSLNQSCLFLTTTEHSVLQILFYQYLLPEQHVSSYNLYVVGVKNIMLWFTTVQSVRLNPKTVGESLCPSLKNNNAKQKDIEDVKKEILLCSALQRSTEQNTL